MAFKDFQEGTAYRYPRRRKELIEKHRADGIDVIEFPS
jgi:hypothetical protein